MGRPNPGPGRSPRRSTPGRLCVEVAGDVAAGGERPDQQGRVVDLAGDRQGLLSLIQALAGPPRRRDGPVGQRPRPHRGRHFRWGASRSVRAVSNQVSPSRMRPRRATAAAATTPAPGPARLRSFPGSIRMRRAGCRSRCGLLDALLIITACRGVELGRHRRVVVAVACPYGVGFAGFAKLFQRVLAHRFQQPVAGSAPAVVGDHERLVDEQGELVEHLVALPRRTAGDRGRRRGRSRPETPPAGETARVRVRSAGRVTSPPTRAGSAGGAPRCVHPRSTAGSGRAGCQRSRTGTTPAPAPPPTRSLAAPRRGAGRSPPRPRHCRR